jgi:hypothetical protein
VPRGGGVGRLGLRRVRLRAAARSASFRPRSFARGLLGLLALFLLAGLLGLHGQQALPVGDGDLVVVGVDLAEGEEAVAVAAELDEGGLEAWFDPDHLAR